MKTLIKILCLLSFLSADDLYKYNIKYLKKGVFSDKTKTIDKAKFAKFDSNSLVFSNSETFLGENMLPVNCDDIILITDILDNKSYDNCTDFLNDISKKDTSYKPKNNQEINKSNDKSTTSLGGMFIGIGGTILLVNTENECDNCETPSEQENFIDESKFINQIGYGFIIIGGIFIAMGI